MRLGAIVGRKAAATRSTVGVSVIEDDHLLAARIAQKLRDAGIRCESINLVPTDKAVLDRDRFVFLLMLTLLTLLAWSYLLGT